MEALYPCCAGLDVPKQTAAACVRRLGPAGKAAQQVRTFGAVTAELLALSDWLAEQGVTHVAMESTGVFWKPISNILEGRFSVLLVNARHIKQVPGRKADVKDCARIAQLLQHGLLRASSAPPRPVRELRDLTRQRARLVGEKAAVANRIQEVLEDANVKLAGVASDVLGASGRDVLGAIVAGEADPGVLANLARQRPRDKLPQLRQALAGRVTEHHRFLPGALLGQVGDLERLIDRFNARIAAGLGPLEAEAAGRLSEAPGFSRRVAEVVLAEVGADMGPFPSADRLCSWAGLCPGNDESAGRRRSGRTTEGSRWLRAALVQAAWAASHSKGAAFAARYRRLAARRGKKRALVALAHTMLGIVYQLLKRGARYQELGAGYLGRSQQERLTRQLVRRLERLGHQVTLQPREEVA